MKRTLRYALLMAISLITLYTSLRAQSSTATLSGVVTDPNGAAIAQATVTLENSGTGARRMTTTNSEGFFTLPLLPPGNYMLTVERTGFITVTNRDVILNVNDQRSLPIQLRVGSVSVQITVTAESSSVQARSVEISGLVDERRVRELPLNGKDFNDLVKLAPGIGGDNSGNPGGSNPSISGARPSGNFYQIDGSGANDERLNTFGLALGGGVASFDSSAPNLVSTEAVQEFRIITSNADAAFGGGSGGQINVITKSGTNQLHGSAYEYLRNNAFDARDFFNIGPLFDSRGRAKNPPFRQNLFGGSIGGPIYREKHFFFGSYEGFRQRREFSTRLFAPNADLIKIIPGDLGRLFHAFYLDRGVVPATGNGNGRFFAFTDAQKQTAIAAGYPAALFDGALANGEAGSTEVLAIGALNLDQDAFTIRTDHRLSNALTATARYSFAQPERVRSTSVPIDFILNPNRWQQATAQFIYQISPTQLLEARPSLMRSKSNEVPLGGVPQSLIDIGVSKELGIVVQQGTGDTDLFVSTSGGIDAQTIPQMAILHTWTRGGLTLRSGAELRRMIVNQANVFGAQPVYTFQGYTGRNGLLGESATQPQAIAATAAATVFGEQGGPRTALRGVRSTQQEYYAQADWRLRRDVTLNLGLRYSYFGVYSEVNGALSNLYAVDSAGRVVPDVSPFAFGRTANRVEVVGDDMSFYQPDRNNFQPRLGVAWDVRGKGQTVLRAGYGLFYDRLYQFIFSGAINNLPFAVSSNAVNIPFRLGVPFPFSPVTTPPQIQGVDPTIRNPYTHRLNLAVEQRLSPSTTVTVAYVGSRARKLVRTLEPNGSGNIPDNLRPDPRFTDQRVYANYSEAGYDSLQVFAHRRLSRGLDFTVAYTYSRLLDDNASDRNIFPRAPSVLNLGANPTQFGIQGGGAQFVERPREADRGLSDNDMTHNLTISHVYDLPFGKGRRFGANANRLARALIGGFSVAGIARVLSGLPFTPTLGRDVNDDGDSSRDRPMLLGGSLDELYASGRGRTQFLLTQAEASAKLGAPAPINDPFVAIRRNALRGPAIATYDVSLVKRFEIGERALFGFEVNAFNVFNRTNFANPQANLTSFGTPNQLFGQIQTTRTPPRQLQFGAKLTF